MNWPTATFQDDPLLLWSASNDIAHRISSQYFGLHYVWCTPIFDGSSRIAGLRSAQPASSDPVTIYRRMHEDARTNDRHSDGIRRQRKSLTRATALYAGDQRITQDQAKEILGLLAKATPRDWSPLIYVIPYAGVRARVQAVPAKQRAGIGGEYLIPDLQASEFEPIELMPCP